MAHKQVCALPAVQWYVIWEYMYLGEYTKFYDISWR